MQIAKVVVLVMWVSLGILPEQVHSSNNLYYHLCR